MGRPKKIVQSSPRLKEEEDAGDTLMVQSRSRRTIKPNPKYNSKEILPMKQRLGSDDDDDDDEENRDVGDNTEDDEDFRDDGARDSDPEDSPPVRKRGRPPTTAPRSEPQPVRRLQQIRAGLSMSTSKMMQHHGAGLLDKKRKIEYDSDDLPENNNNKRGRPSIAASTPTSTIVRTAATATTTPKSSNGPVRILNSGVNASSPVARATTTVSATAAAATPSTGITTRRQQTIIATTTSSNSTPKNVVNAKTPATTAAASTTTTPRIISAATGASTTPAKSMIQVRRATPMGSSPNSSTGAGAATTTATTTVTSPAAAGGTTVVQVNNKNNNSSSSNPASSSPVVAVKPEPVILNKIPTMTMRSKTQLISPRPIKQVTATTTTSQAAATVVTAPSPVVSSSPVIRTLNGAVGRPSVTASIVAPQSPINNQQVTTTPATQSTIVGNKVIVNAPLVVRTGQTTLVVPKGAEMEQMADGTTAKITSVETRFVVKVPPPLTQQQQDEVALNVVPVSENGRQPMKLLQLRSNIKRVKLPANWSFQSKLVRMAAGTRSDEELPDRPGYMVHSIVFGRSREGNKKPRLANGGGGAAGDVKYDRSVEMLRNQFVVTVDGEQVKLIEAPLQVTSVAEVDHLLEILERVDLESPLVKVVKPAMRV